jgi:hypothetical protein
VSDRGAGIHGGTIVMTWVAGMLSSHGMVTTGAGGAPVPCLEEKEKLEPPSPLEAV